jgi:hypothetical protein
MLVTSDDLSAYMGGLDMSTEELAIVDSIILPGLQEELEIFLNRPVEPVQVRESLIVDEYGFITLSVTPVWEVIKVMWSDGSLIEGTTYIPPVMVDDPTVERSIDWSGLGQYPQPFRYSIGMFGLTATHYWEYGPLRYVIVEYIGGQKGYTDNALRLAILRVAAREVERQFDDSASLVGGNVEAVQASDPRTKGWLPEELARFNRMRRRVVV